MSGIARVAASGRNPSVGFSPMNVAPGCVLWLSARRGVQLVSGAVSQWNDLSGHGNNVVQGTPSARPTYNPSDTLLGGYPSIGSNAASSQSLNSATFTLAQPYTVFLVGYAPSGQNAALSGTATANYFGIGSNIGFAAAPTQHNSQALTNTALPSIVGAVASGAASIIYANATASNLGAANIGTNGFTSLNLFQITGVASYTSTIAEVAIFNSALPLFQVSQIFTGFSNLYRQGWS